ncbi:hypothetical protein HDU97_001042 [Phlyctochytrium planicorne]|nr:hypothetical protein HDU97_001042 [Phlyctochytrium planicorne]
MAANNDEEAASISLNSNSRAPLLIDIPSSSPSSSNDINSYDSLPHYSTQPTHYSNYGSQPMKRPSNKLWAFFPGAMSISNSPPTSPSASSGKLKHSSLLNADGKWWQVRRARIFLLAVLLVLVGQVWMGGAWHRDEAKNDVGRQHHHVSNHQQQQPQHFVAPILDDTLAKDDGNGVLAADDSKPAVNASSPGNSANGTSLKNAASFSFVSVNGSRPVDIFPPPKDHPNSPFAPTSLWSQWRHNKTNVPSPFKGQFKIPPPLYNLYIPRLIHMTVPSKTAIKPEVQAALDAWQRMNPETDVILHDDLDMVDLVVLEGDKFFPGCSEVYRSLKKGVERADFWRYLVVFLRGGVYVDSDVFPLRPLDAWADHFDLYVDGEEGKSEKEGGDGKVGRRGPVNDVEDELLHYHSGKSRVDKVKDSEKEKPSDKKVDAKKGDEKKELDSKKKGDEEKADGKETDKNVGDSKKSDAKKAGNAKKGDAKVKQEDDEEEEEDEEDHLQNKKDDDKKADKKKKEDGKKSSSDSKAAADAKANEVIELEEEFDEDFAKAAFGGGDGSKNKADDDEESDDDEDKKAGGKKSDKKSKKGGDKTSDGKKADEEESDSSVNKKASEKKTGKKADAKKEKDSDEKDAKKKNGDEEDGDAEEQEEEGDDDEEKGGVERANKKDDKKADGKKDDKKVDEKKGDGKKDDKKVDEKKAEKNDDKKEQAKVNDTTADAEDSKKSDRKLNQVNLNIANNSTVNSTSNYTSNDASAANAKNATIPFKFHHHRHNKNSTAGLKRLFLQGIIGAEAHLTEENRIAQQFVYRVQYCQWTFAFTPYHPFLHDLISSIIRYIRDEQAGLIPPTGNWAMDLLMRTGPGAFTRAAEKWIKEETKKRGKERNGGKAELVGEDIVDEYEEVGGVGFMPPFAFGHRAWLDEAPPSNLQVLVEHHFSGSWKGH